MSDDLIRLEITADNTGATGAFREVSASADQLSSNLKEVGTAGTVAGNEIAAGMQKADFSMREAKGTAMLLGEEIGVKMNRHVAGFVATLPGVGEAMSAAFSAFAVVGLADILVRVTEKATDWIAKTFIMTDAMKELDSQLKADNVTIAKMAEHVTALNLQMELMGKSASQKTGILMGLKEDEINAQAEAVRALSDKMHFLREAGEGTSVEYGKLSSSLDTATHHLNELVAEQGVLSATFDQDKAKEEAESIKKLAEEHKKLQAELKRTAEGQLAMHQYLLDNAASNAAIDLKELEENASKLGDTLQALKDQQSAPSQGDVDNPFGNEQIQKMVKYQEQLHKIAEANESAMSQVISVQTLMTKGWGAFGEAAIKGMEQASMAVLQHVVVALLADDMLKLSAAKTAAAKAYSAEAGIPIVGPILAPLAAATAFAGAMAFKQGGVVPSAAGGMLTDAYGPGEGTISLLHPNEMVLPAPLSQTVQDMAASATGSKGSGAGVHIENMHAMDSKSFEQFLKSNPMALSRGVEHATDKGHLNVGKLARGK